MTREPPEFLDVNALLERSLPRQRTGWFGYAVGVFTLLVLLTTYLSGKGPMWEALVKGLSALGMLGVMAAMIVFTLSAARRQRAEMQQIEAIEELVQLRRWPQAALMIQGLLSEPTRTMVARIQALIYLASVLARYQRFEDAIGVQTYLLTHVNLDESTAHGLRLGRAMAMLREDHLVDADRAMSELRRSDAGQDSGGLALVEIYRDVKTGHPAEAIEIFKEKLSAIRQQLGHRVADAWGLIAKAHDMQGDEAAARNAYANATLLSPASELHRRYPELSSLTEKFAPSSAPDISGQTAEVA